MNHQAIPSIHQSINPSIWRLCQGKWVLSGLGICKGKSHPLEKCVLLTLTLSLPSTVCLFVCALPHHPLPSSRDSKFTASRDNCKGGTWRDRADRCYRTVQHPARILNLRASECLLVLDLFSSIVHRAIPSHTRHYSTRLDHTENPRISSTRREPLRQWGSSSASSFSTSSPTRATIPFCLATHISPPSSVQMVPESPTRMLPSRLPSFQHTMHED